MDALPWSVKSIIVIVLPIVMAAMYGLVFNTMIASIAPKQYTHQICMPRNDWQFLKSWKLKTQDDPENTTRQFIDAPIPWVVFISSLRLDTVVIGFIIGILCVITLYPGNTPTLSMKSILILFSLVIPIVFLVSLTYGAIMMEKKDMACGEFAGLTRPMSRASYITVCIVACILCIVMGSLRLKYRKHDPSHVIELF